MSGSNSTTLPIRVIDDDTIELSELATVILTEIVLDGNTDPDVSSALGAQINPLTSSSAVTIQANDYPHGLITFSLSSRSVTVDEPGTGNITSVSLTIIREYGLIGMLYTHVLYNINLLILGIDSNRGELIIFLYHYLIVYSLSLFSAETAI